MVSKKFEKQEVEFQFLFLPRSFLLLLLFSFHVIPSPEKHICLSCGKEKYFIYYFCGISVDDVYTTPITQQKKQNLDQCLLQILFNKGITYINFIFIQCFVQKNASSLFVVTERGLLAGCSTGAPRSNKFTVIPLGYKIA